MDQKSVVHTQRRRARALLSRLKRGGPEEVRRQLDRHQQRELHHLLRIPRHRRGLESALRRRLFAALSGVESQRDVRSLEIRAWAAHTMREAADASYWELRDLLSQTQRLQLRDPLRIQEVA